MNIDTNNTNNECSICLNIIDGHKIDCIRCNNKNCLECFNKMDKKIKYIDKNVVLEYKCPQCQLEVSIDIFDTNNIIKYDLNKFIKDYIIELNNGLIQSNISNNILNSRLMELQFIFRNFYNIIKMVYIFDKVLLLGITTIIFIAYKN